MTQVDVKVSTDPTGLIEHWERRFTPSLPSDRIAVMGLLDGTHFLGYSDGSGAAGDSGTLHEFDVLVREVVNAGGTIELVMGLLYFDPVDITLDAKATLGAYRFRTGYAVVTSQVVDGERVVLAFDLWDGGVSGSAGFRPTSSTDTVAMSRILVEPTRTALVPDLVVESSAVDRTLAYEVAFNDDALAAILGADDIWAVRVRVQPQPLSISDDLPEADIQAFVRTTDTTGWGADLIPPTDTYNPMFVIEYTLPGTPTVPSAPKPRRLNAGLPIRHVARQQLGRQRQSNFDLRLNRGGDTL